MGFEVAVEFAGTRAMLMDVGSGTLRPAAAAPPAVTSARGPWSGLLLEQYPAGGHVELKNVAPTEHHLLVHLDEPASFEWQDGDRNRCFEFKAGEAMFCPAMVPFSMRCLNGGRFLALVLDRAFLRSTAHELVTGADALGWKPTQPFEDPLVRSIASTLSAEVRAAFAGGRAYGEMLATSLAAHLVRHQATPRTLARFPRGGLARFQLRRVVEYIHQHLAEDLSLATLAATAGLSPFHFSRLFKRSTGMTPHVYLVRLRVERARELLLSSTQSTVEVAGTVGFCDQSHLTMHFKRAFGITPKAFQRREGRRSLFL